MGRTAAGARQASDVRSRRRHDRRTWALLYAGCLFTTLVMGALAYRRAPGTFPLALLVLLLGCVVMIFRPVLGLQLTVFFSLIGDIFTVGSWPFTKNLSSQESLLFISKQLNVSPLEVWMLVGLAGLVMQMAAQRRWTLVKGRLHRPVMVFGVFLVLGLGYGLATGGDSKAALSEARAMFYVPLLYVLATNLMKRRADYVRMYRLAMVAVVINALLGLRHFHYLGAAAQQNPESLMQHSTALVMNVLVVWLLALRLMHGGSRLLRFGLLLGAVPTMLVYLEAKRRAAIVGLVAAAVLLLLVLFFTNRRRFRRLFPAVAIVAVVYLGAFWNSTGSSLGFPAQAVKSVIAPSQMSDRDQSSNYYRVLETFDIRATIRSSPLTGIGFGQPFLRPIPLPPIVDFALEAYVSHNSMLWVWMKLGVGGFVAMIYLFGTALYEGVRAVRRDLRGSYAALTVTSLAYVLMYGVYTYVDIAWDTKTMVLLGLVLAQIDSCALLPRETETAAPARSSGPATRPELASTAV